MSLARAATNVKSQSLTYLHAYTTLAGADIRLQISLPDSRHHHNKQPVLLVLMQLRLLLRLDRHGRIMARGLLRIWLQKPCCVILTWDNRHP